jgi:hypothetical protein
MKHFSSRKEVVFIIIAFVVSRIIAGLFGVHFEYDALYKYWQYLDEQTLRHNLLNGVWYDHAQPPFFNLFIGVVLKFSGAAAPYVLAVIFKLITLVNALLICALLKKLTGHSKVPLLLSLFYLLSPAAIVYESELFYTSFVTLLFLICAWFLLHLTKHISWKHAFGFFTPLILICLTRSMYHLIWLLVIALVMLIYCKRKPGLYKLVFTAFFALVITGAWYVKNYIVFGEFSASTWIGMNLSRNVFHDNEFTDSSRIEAYAPFSKISVYRQFIPEGYERKFAGLNDRDLLQEMKNDSFMNMNHVSYIIVSKKYMDACKKYIKAHPTSYIKNVAQSCIIYFAPATRYSVTEFQARKIKYYDAVYSFNLSHFAKGKQQRRIALSISAIPKMLAYFLAFFWLVRDWIRTRKIGLLNLFISVVIGYVFVVSSLLEHYENMRFRFELEPLFLLLAGQAIVFFRRPQPLPFSKGERD